MSHTPTDTQALVLRAFDDWRVTLPSDRGFNHYEGEAFRRALLAALRGQGEEIAQVVRLIEDTPLAPMEIKLALIDRVRALRGSAASQAQMLQEYGLLEEFGPKIGGALVSYLAQAVVEARGSAAAPILKPLAIIDDRPVEPDFDAEQGAEELRGMADLVIHTSPAASPEPSAETLRALHELWNWSTQFEHDALPDGLGPRIVALLENRVRQIR